MQDRGSPAILVRGWVVLGFPACQPLTRDNFTKFVGAIGAALFTTVLRQVINMQVSGYYKSYFKLKPY